MIDNKEKNFISAVIYVHNNEKHIKTFLEKINDALSKNFEKYEIICVNDKSTDNSIEEIKKIGSTIDGIIQIVNMSYYQGLELSMNAGVDLSVGDFVYEFDNIILDYDLDVIMQVYNEALNGYDIVSATSNKKRRITSSIFYSIFNKSFKGMYPIHTETFRILSRRAINRVKTLNATIPYRKVAYANCGLKLNSVQYESINNTSLKFSKEVHKARKSLGIDSLILFTDVAYKFSISMAFIMMLLTLVTGIYTVLIFLNSKPIAGWTTTMLLLSVAFFGTFAILTIIIKYLTIVIDLIFRKQQYLIESIEKIK